MLADTQTTRGQIGAQTQMLASGHRLGQCPQPPRARRLWIVRKRKKKFQRGRQRQKEEPPPAAVLTQSCQLQPETPNPVVQLTRNCARVPKRANARRTMLSLILTINLKRLMGPRVLEVDKMRQHQSRRWLLTIDKMQPPTKMEPLPLQQWTTPPKT